MDFLKVCSYNCRGLPKDRNKLSLRPDITTMFEENHIVALQETWLSKQNLHMLNSLHSSFEGTGVAKIDESIQILQGRYSGGVALLWRKELGRYVQRIDLAVDWCVAIELTLNSTKLVIFSVYLPYQCNDNEDDYINCLSAIKTFIDELDCTNFIIIGDWNANLGTSGSALFQPLMLDFCNENQFIISSKCLLPDNTYTHVHTREGNLFFSWLDHIVSSSNCHNAISNITVHYDMTDDDHFPISLVLQVQSLPKLSKSKNNINGKVKWETLSQKDIKDYYYNTQKALGEIDIPISSVLCSNPSCADNIHTSEIDNLFESKKSALYNSSPACNGKPGNYTPRPGWTDYVSDLYDLSRETRRMWLDNGKPRQGMIHQMFVQSKRRFKCALNYITKNEDALRRESLAKKLTNLSSNEFWREISSINNSKIMLPTSIEDATGADEISTLWKNHFKSIFNCLQNFNKLSTNYNVNSSFNDLRVTTDEVIEAIKKLELNKSSGADKIQAEHIKYANEKLIPLISICFTSFFVHGYLPKSLLTVVLVPIVKKKLVILIPLIIIVL